MLSSHPAPSRRPLRHPWRRGLAFAIEGSRPLALLAFGSFWLLVATFLLSLVDERQVLGASTWLKPSKFAASMALTAVTLALLLRVLPLPPKGGRRAVCIIVGTAVLELAIIVVQAARGVPSHFNNATRGDLVAFQLMGAGITAMTVAIAYIAFQAFRHRFADVAMGWGIRLGLTIMLAGSGLGFIMPPPTSVQLATLRAGAPTPLVGAHAVGVPDGGPGLPVTRWSTEGGDLRVPHFLGLHALQLLPLTAFLLSRRRPGTREVATRQVLVIAGGYVGVTAVALLQALRGQPLLSPDPATWSALCLVLLACAWGILHESARAPEPTGYKVPARGGGHRA